MKQTLNYTNRHDLHKSYMQDIRRTDEGILFKILDLDEHVKNYDFSTDDTVILFAQDKLCVETIHIGTIGDVLQFQQSKSYPINDKAILNSNDLSIDVHIVDPDGKIKSRTDKIYLGRGNKPNTDESTEGNIPFDIHTREMGKRIYEIDSENDNIICFVSEKIPNLKENLLDKSSVEFALLGPIILKEAFIYALITHTDSTGENLEYWKRCLLDHTEHKELPDAVNETDELISLINDFARDYTEKNKLQNVIHRYYQGDGDA